MKKNWLELIEGKEQEIIEVATKAYKEALENTHLKYIVEMDSDGDVYYWYDAAGGNNFHISNDPDREIQVLMTFCNQYFDIMSEFEGFETEEEAIEWCTDQFAYEEITDKLEYIKEEIKN